MMDIKLQFWYTFILNHTNYLDQVLNLFLELYYEKIGPTIAFDAWWSYFLVEKLGKAYMYRYNKIN